MSEGKGKGKGKGGKSSKGGSKGASKKSKKSPKKSDDDYYVYDDYGSNGGKGKGSGNEGDDVIWDDSLDPDDPYKDDNCKF